MTDTEIIQTIAELRGWTEIRKGDAFGTLVGKSPTIQSRDPWRNEPGFYELPHYLRDANTAREFEATLTDEEWEDYVFELTPNRFRPDEYAKDMSVYSALDFARISKLPQRERAIAFLKVKGKYQP